jgi:hypothetical protein
MEIIIKKLYKTGTDKMFKGTMRKASHVLLIPHGWLEKNGYNFNKDMIEMKVYEKKIVLSKHTI